MKIKARTAVVGLALCAAALPAEAGQDSARKAPAGAAALACRGGAEAKAAAPQRPPLLVEGLGYAGIVPDTQNAEARRWFEQGVRLTWAFDEVEAIRSFEQAQRLDPNCAMCAWGEAWARGPTINLQPRTEELAKAAAASKRAASLASRLEAPQRALVAAMQVRTGGKGAFRNKKYAKAMAKVARRFPADDAILVIAADAQMVTWGDKAPEGTDAQRYLETVLARNPDHSGAIHMYIHLTDWVERQDLAERYADRLGRVAPGASHLVHMPAHTFFGVGRYADAAAVNVAALAADNDYVDKVKPPASEYRTGLYAHNAHFAIGGALMRGDGETALKIADHFQERYPAEAKEGFRAVIRASTWYAYGLHAPPGKVLAMAEPPAEMGLMRGMRLYARGEALARRGDGAGVRREAEALAALRAGPEGRALGGQRTETLLEIAQHVLEGRAAMIASDYKGAIAAFRTAMTLQEDAGFGFDPPPFWYPVRRSLGAAMIASGDFEGGRNQLAASLEDWPKDPLALYALSRAELALGKKAEAARNLAAAKAGWLGNVETMPLSRV